MLNVRRLIYKTRRDEMNSLIDLCVCDIESKLYENNMLINNGNVRFLVDRCAVVEYYKSNNYVYYAININNLKMKHLCFRKKQITENDYEDFEQRVLRLGINTKDLTLKPTRYMREKKLLSHIFSHILPKQGFSLRKNQLDLALEMLYGLETGSISLMEAEVGTGKTHAYIMAVIIHNIFNNIQETTVISTSTIALQKAITEEYIPQISKVLTEYKILRKPIKFIVRKGKSHYACEARLKTYFCSVLNNNMKSDEDLIAILRKIISANEYEIDLDAYRLTRYTKNKICVNNKCNDTCIRYKECRFISFNKRCLEDRYDFQIANHNYVFANILSKRPLLPEYKVLIFDEAHKLYEVAKQMYGCYFSDTEVPHLAQYIETSDNPSIMGSCSIIKGYNTKIFNQLIRNAPSKFLESTNERMNATFNNRCVGYMNELVALLTDLHEKVYVYEDLKTIMRRKNIQKMCRDISNKLNIFINAKDLICWLENEGNSVKLCSIPKELNKMVARDIWNTEVAHILTSGTLSANGDFGLLKNKTGINLINPKRIREISKASPFDYQKNTLIYIPEYIPFPDLKDELYIKAISDEIARLLKATYGHALVLFTSYWLMEKVFNNISVNSYEYPLFVMGRGRIDALKEFKISGNGVLFASDAAGEGVDIVGDTLSNLIIVKLPFSVPDPISEYEQSVLGGLKAYIDKINTPNMIIKLKQYAGRLIRSETDTGIVAILDNRVNSRGKYRTVVLDALFDTTVTDNILDVERFLYSKKDSSYFE